MGPGVFIGELAFLTKNPATANVCLNKQAKGVSWNSSDLTRLLATRPQMKVAFDSLLNNDLASKLSNDSNNSGGQNEASRSRLAGRRSWLL